MFLITMRQFYQTMESKQSEHSLYEHLGTIADICRNSQRYYSLRLTELLCQIQRCSSRTLRLFSAPTEDEEKSAWVKSFTGEGYKFAVDVQLYRGAKKKKTGGVAQDLMEVRFQPDDSVPPCSDLAAVM
ncbi:hypothetical protein RUM44_006904 [Polyplax serrata]|uniref:Uncharacterized protein n=1 Tax=Polyplax serrata TaxID=468196 RepID=A0ABR1AZP0_POLSC